MQDAMSLHDHNSSNRPYDELFVDNPIIRWLSGLAQAYSALRPLFNICWIIELPHIRILIC